MNNKYFKTFNLIKNYKEFLNKNYTIIDDGNNKINFDLKFGTFCHLIGLHYCNKNSTNAIEIGKLILENKIKDFKIMELLKVNNPSKLNLVKSRIDNIDFALKNLDNGYVVKSNKSIISDINSTNFILQTKDNKFLEIGLVNKFDDEYYLETFLIRNNDNNVDYSKHSKIKGIYKEDESYELKPFSFDEKKQKILDTFPEYNYLQCMKIYENAINQNEMNKEIDKSFKEENTNNAWENWKKNKSNDFER